MVNEIDRQRGRGKKGNKYIMHPVGSAKASCPDAKWHIMTGFSAGLFLLVTNGLHKNNLSVVSSTKPETPDSSEVSLK